MTRLFLVACLLFAAGCDSLGEPAPPATFELRLATDTPTDGFTERPDFTDGLPIFIASMPIIANNDVENATVVEQEYGPTIVVRLTPASGEVLGEATASHIGKPVAILVNDEILAAPIVRDRITTDVMITGDFTKDEAKQIAKGILAGRR